jgi:hypothetical protein
MSVLAHEVAVAMQLAVPEVGSQQCWELGLQYAALPPLPTLKGQYTLFGGVGGKSAPGAEHPASSGVPVSSGVEESVAAFPSSPPSTPFPLTHRLLAQMRPALHVPSA